MYVLQSIYEGLYATNHRWDSERILGPAHPCCGECQHVLITGEMRTAFEAAALEAQASGAFGEIFACWNCDGNIIGLFGRLNDFSQLVMLGEYAVRGSLIPYEHRIKKVRERYRAFLPARIVIVAMLILGIRFEVPFFAHLFHPDSAATNPGPTLLGGLLLVFGGVSTFISLRNYLLLRQQPMEPLANRLSESR
jgi:hypothetical protein